jgi:hypothetical protein
MDKIKPFENIAARFHISAESAKYFLNHVQKSFKVEKPPHKLIVEFIEAQQIQSLPATPYELAALLKEKGAWFYALNSPPPAVVDDEDLAA